MLLFVICILICIRPQSFWAVPFADPNHKMSSQWFFFILLCTEEVNSCQKGGLYFFLRKKHFFIYLQWIFYRPNSKTIRNLQCIYSVHQERCLCLSDAALYRVLDTKCFSLMPNPGDMYFVLRLAHCILLRSLFISTTYIYIKQMN